MVSLSTVYLISILLTSAAGFGSAYVAKKFVGGAVTTLPPSESIPEPPSEPKDQSVLSTAIQSGFGMDQEFADGIIEFIQTPVVEWNKIASTSSELRRKFMRTLTHPNLNKCPQELLKVCELVSKKYSNMKDFIEGNSYQNDGDQTQEAIALLSSSEQTEPPASSESS